MPWLGIARLSTVLSTASTAFVRVAALAGEFFASLDVATMRLFAADPWGITLCICAIV
jgi:hypothetical protein